MHEAKVAVAEGHTAVGIKGALRAGMKSQHISRQRKHRSLYRLTEMGESLVRGVMHLARDIQRERVSDG